MAVTTATFPVAKAVIAWFNTGGRSGKLLPTEEQVEPLLTFLRAAIAGETARLEAYRNPRYDKSFMGALIDVQAAAERALTYTRTNGARVAEELPPDSAIANVLQSKFGNDEAALLDLIRVSLHVRDRFKPDPNHAPQNLKSANWHEAAFALLLISSEVFQALGRTPSIGKPTSPMIAVITSALTLLYDHGLYRNQPPSAEAVQKALQRRTSFPLLVKGRTT